MRAVDLSSPHEWYPVARSLHRRIIYHAGPTNSGKTYQALQARRTASEALNSSTAVLFVTGCCLVTFAWKRCFCKEGDPRYVALKSPC